MDGQYQTKLLNRYFVLVWLCALGLNICQNILNNVVSLYTTSLGLSTSFAGFLGIPYAVFAILMRFWGGDWVDRHGRRGLLVFSCFGFAISALLFGCFPAMFALVVFRALHGLCFSAGQLTASTVNVDVTPPENATTGIGIFWVASALAYGGAGYIVTSLTAGGSYQPVFIACAIAGGAGGILALLCRYEKKRTPSSPAPRSQPEEVSPTAQGIYRFLEPKAIKPAVLILLMAISVSSVSLYLLLFAQEMGYAYAGMAFVLAAVSMAIGNLTSSRQLHSLGPGMTLLLSYGICGILYASMSLIHSPVTYMLGGIAAGYIQGICMPVLYYLAVKDMPVLRRGVAGGTIYCMLDVGMGLGTWLWGVVIELSSFTVMYLLAAAIFLVAAVLTIVFYRPGRAVQTL